MERNNVDVNEDMLKDIMAGNIPVFGKDSYSEGSVAAHAASETTAPESKRQADTAMPSERNPGRPKKRKDEANDYRRTFLTQGNIQHRQQTYISCDNYQFLRRFLSLVAPEVSISRFVDNLLVLHFGQFKDEIDRLYNEAITNPLYDK